MAASPLATQPARQTHRRQALIWLMMTLVLAVVTALVWMFNQTPSMTNKIENAPLSAPQLLTPELKQPLTIEALHELDNDVQPISFDASIRDLRSYPDEFKDKRYLLANKGKWTVQVMNVAENDVVVSYLEGRDDREKFAYFRYVDEDNQLRYMLTYGLMSSPQEAVGGAKLIDFKLPANVRVLPEEISRYISIIDDYERQDPVKDLSASRARAVNLKPTRREVPPRRQQETSAENTSTRGVASTDRATGASTNEAVSSNESIRQSEDTTATLSVSEERSIASEGSTSSSTTPKTEPVNKKSDVEKNAPKKPPVIATPKPPTAPTNNSATTSNTANKGANSSNTKNNNYSIKALIEEKNN